MKLIDFTSYEPLNELRRKIGANDLGSYSVDIVLDRLSLDELKEIGTSGIVITSLDEVVKLPDGTLAYKDSRVVLYIRDKAYHQFIRGAEKLPRYHVAFCRTLTEMKARKRWERYVVSTRHDGIFEIHVVDEKQRISKNINKELNVCQNCLDMLAFDGFTYSDNKSIRMPIVENFTLERFFEKYPKSPIRSTPNHTEKTSPENRYSSDFDNISLRYKESVNWICEKCHKDLQDKTRRRYLHTHHINAQKNDNRPSNLKALCIACHAEEYKHGHVKMMPDYKKYMAIKDRIAS